MAASKEKEERDLWIAFAQAALSSYEVPSKGVDNTDEVADDQVEVATKVADSMLDELDKRYGESRKKADRRRRRDDDEDEEEDEDEDDEDED